MFSIFFLEKIIIFSNPGLLLIIRAYALKFLSVFSVTMSMFFCLKKQILWLILYIVFQ